MKTWLTRKRLAALSGLFVALLAGYTVTLVVSVNGPNGSTSTTITLPGSSSTPATTVAIPSKVAARAAAFVEDHLKSENPPGVSNQQLDAIHNQQDALAATDQLPIIAPDAAPSFPGCVTRSVRNHSSRRGVKPRVIFDHYTVSPNVPGWADVWAVVHHFDIPATLASSHFVLDGEGHCTYIVPITEKAWTEAAANSIGVGIEIINSGSEKTLLGPAGKLKLAQIHSYLGKLLGIPMQRAILRSCVIVRPGITDHNSLGLCGGGHHDICNAATFARGGCHGDYTFSVAQLIAEAKAYSTSTKPQPVVYTVTIWKPHTKARRIRTDRPGMAVARATKHGYTRISVVRAKRG